MATLCCVAGCTASATHWHHVKPKSEGGKRTVPMCPKHHVEHHSTRGDFRRWGQQGGKRTAQKTLSNGKPAYTRNLKQFR